MLYNELSMVSCYMTSYLWYHAVLQVVRDISHYEELICDITRYQGLPVA